MSIGYLCSTCVDPNKKTLFCGYCHTASYCSRECQRSNWETHKLICRNEDLESAKERREKCLKLFLFYTQAAFSLLDMANALEKRFMAVYESVDEPLVFSVKDKEEVFGKELSEQNHLALSFAIEQTQKMINGKLRFRGIPVLYVAGNKIHSVYILGSRKLLQLIWAVQKLHSDLFNSLFPKHIETPLERCLKLVTFYSEAVFSFICKSIYWDCLSFLVVYESGQEPHFFPVKKSGLEYEEFFLSEQNRYAFACAIKKTQILVCNAILFQGIPVVYVAQKRTYVYILGSEQMFQFVRSIQKLPLFVFRQFMYEYENRELELMPQNYRDKVYEKRKNRIDNDHMRKPPS